MKINRHLISLAAAALAIIAIGPAGHADEACQTCSRKVVIHGATTHFNAGNIPIAGAAAGQAKAFQEEIYGPAFELSVPDLEPGKYTAVFGFAEVYFHEAGKRVFDITCRGQAIAPHFDIFAKAGGARKACYLTSEVTQPAADSAPLTFAFRAVVDNAKFNTFELKDAAGQTLASVSASDFGDLALLAARKPPEVSGPELWKDPSQPESIRVRDLVRRLSLAEKVLQLQNNAPAIPRVGLPAYDYWSECLHGVGRAGVATVFPQAIGMAATWDPELIHDEADVISTEGRAIHNAWVREHNGDSARYRGLTFWSPNINIFRDPRWGRGQETFGEDPFLTARIGVAFIRGLQGDNPKYIKAMACAKHFDAHSGPEAERHRFNAVVGERDFYETYLPQFEAAVREGRVGGVMGAYTSLNGKPACADPFLLTDLLRRQWGFDGYVVSDCGAILDIYANHKYVASAPEAAAVAVKAGCNLCCGGDYRSLVQAVKDGLISEQQVDAALATVLTTRFRLGLFDPPSMVPYAGITLARNDTPEHRALALKVARESVVLLKNNGVLPLNPAELKRIAVFGANANSVPLLLGNYNGTPSHPVTILDGLKTIAGPNVEVVYQEGCPLALPRSGANRPNVESVNKAIELARSADAVIYVGGISPSLEGEEMRVSYEGFAGGDRTKIELPAVQTEFLKSLKTAGKPMVFVNCSGSAMAMPWAVENVPAILQAWYPGEEGGRAVAEVLFGVVNPAGRLPVTFYRSTEDLPSFDDYSMSNRTYRYFDGKPEFAFGHGLSYTKFAFREVKVDSAKVRSGDTLKLTFDLANTGAMDGDEVAQVYFRHVKSSLPQARLALCAFKRVHVPGKQTARVAIEIPAARFRYWDTASDKYVVEPGEYELLVGAASDDIRSHLGFEVRAEQ